MSAEVRPVERAGRDSGEPAAAAVPTAPGHWVDLGVDREPPPVPPGWTRRAAPLAEALFTTADGPPPERRLRWLVAGLADFLDAAGARSRLVLRLSLWVVTWVAPLMILSLPPLRRLPVARRLRALERLERSPLGLSALALKTVYCLLWYEHPAEARRIGFDGRCGGARP